LYSHPAIMGACIGQARRRGAWKHWRRWGVVYAGVFLAIDLVHPAAPLWRLQP
jgi:hypothetical protein